MGQLVPHMGVPVLDVAVTLCLHASHPGRPACPACTDLGLVQSLFGGQCELGSTNQFVKEGSLCSLHAACCCRLMLCQSLLPRLCDALVCLCLSLPIFTGSLPALLVLSSGLLLCLLHSEF